MNYYPSSLPPPQQRGYNYKIKPNIIRTQMADGHVRQRLVNTGTPHELSVTFMFSQSQYQEFMAWYRNDISYGQDWFCMKLLNEYGGTESVCRIQKGELSTTLNCVNSDGPLWSVQCRLDVEPGIGGGSDSGGGEVWIEAEDWDELYVYIWAPYTVTADWPGLELHKNEAGFYVLRADMLDACYPECFAVFHNNDSRQTGDISLEDYDQWRGCVIRLYEYESFAEIVSNDQ